MIRIAILGGIGSGKTFVSNKFGYPVFNADKEVANIYEKNKACFLRFKKKFPKFVNTYPIDKNEIKNLILKLLKIHMINLTRDLIVLKSLDFQLILEKPF